MRIRIKKKLNKVKSIVFRSWRRVIESLTLIASGLMIIYGTYLISVKAAWFVAATVIVLVEQLTIGDRRK